MPVMTRPYRTPLAAALLLLTAFPLASLAQEKRSPADFYVPTSAHMEMDRAVSVDVTGLEEIKTVDDVLAFRQRALAKEYSREDLLSWKILGEIGVTKKEREQPPGVRLYPEWRDVIVDLDAGNYAMRGSCEGYRSLRIDTSRAHVDVSFGQGRSVTIVNHYLPGGGMNIQRCDLATALLRSEKRFSGEWETLRVDESGTLFRKTIVLDQDRGVIEHYLLAEPQLDEVRAWVFVANGRLFRFLLGLQSLPAETSSECVVPEIVLSFDHSGEDWQLDAHRFKTVTLDVEPPADAFAYPLRVGDHYQAHTPLKGVVAERIVFGGLDVASISPGAGLELVRARTKRP